MRALVLLLLALPVVGDEVRLRSGGTLSCEVLEESAESVRVRLPHGVMVIPRDRIVEIVREERGRYLEREAASSLRAGSARNAVELYERAWKENGSDETVRRGLADALAAYAAELLDANRVAAARVRIDRLESLDAAHASLTRLKGRVVAGESAMRDLRRRAIEAFEARRFDEAIRLLAALRQRSPAADETVRRALADAHIGSGNAAGASGALRDALDHFRAAAGYGAAERVEHALRLLRPIAVLEELKEGDVSRAGRLVDGMATGYPDAAVPVFLRAIVHHVRGEMDEAVAGYAEAERVASKRVRPAEGVPYEVLRRYATATLRAAVSAPTTETSRRWRERFLAPLRHERSEHFDVHAPTLDLAREVGRVADAAYERIARELLGGVPAAPRAEIVVHPGRESYVAADPLPAGSPLAAAVTITRRETRGVTYESVDGASRRTIRIEMHADEPSLLSDTLPHELVHVVQRRGLSVFRRAHWLDEGLATIYESRGGRDARLGRLSRHALLPLPQFFALQSTPPRKASAFYDQAHAVTTFLRDAGGAGDWRRFLDALASDGLERALLDVYRIRSVDELEQRWRAAHVSTDRR